jgi:uncharacterized protein (TIRG00374 family)
MRDNRSGLSSEAAPSAGSIWSGVLGTFLGLAVSALFIWLTFRDIDTTDLWRNLPNLPLAPILLCLGAQALIQILRLVRWGVLLRHMGQVTWKRVLAMGAVGLAILYILPARLGELARPLLASDETDIDFGRASSTVVTERFSDAALMGLVILGTLYALARQSLAYGLITTSYLFLALIPSAIGFFVVSIWQRDRLANLIRRMLGVVSPSIAARVASLFEGFVDGIRQATDRQVVVPYMGMTAAIWICEALSLYWLFGILRADLSFLTAVTVLCALVVAATLPAGPGQVGLFEYAIVFGLGPFSVDAATAAFYGTVFHVIVTIPLIITGILGIWLGGISLSRVFRRSPRSPVAT